MSILPTKVLVATDGSREAQLAAQTAADLSQKTNSELHVVHVFGIAPVGPPVYPEATRVSSKKSDLSALGNTHRAPECSSPPRDLPLLSSPRTLAPRSGRARTRFRNCP
jgi:nucleotide-binding universal stress UspA family protein